jgi:hypothetical protein
MLMLAGMPASAGMTDYDPISDAEEKDTELENFRL